MSDRIPNIGRNQDVSRPGPEHPAPVKPMTAADLDSGRVWLLVETALKSGQHPVEHCRTLFEFEPTEYCRGIIDQAIYRGVTTVDHLNPPNWWLDHAWIIVLGWEEWRMRNVRPTAPPAPWWPDNPSSPVSTGFTRSTCSDLFSLSGVLS